MSKNPAVENALMNVSKYEIRGLDTLKPEDRKKYDNAKAIVDNEYKKISADLNKTSGAASAGGDAGGKNVITMADIQRTAASSGKTVEEVRAAAAAKGYTIQ
jgi:hypothetical protein